MVMLEGFLKYSWYAIYMLPILANANLTVTSEDGKSFDRWRILYSDAYGGVTHAMLPIA